MEPHLSIIRLCAVHVVSGLHIHRQRRTSEVGRGQINRRHLLFYLEIIQYTLATGPPARLNFIPGASLHAPTSQLINQRLWALCPCTQLSRLPLDVAGHALADHSLCPRYLFSRLRQGGVPGDSTCLRPRSNIKTIGCQLSPAHNSSCDYFSKCHGVLLLRF